MTDMVSALKEITLRNKAGDVARVVHDNRIHTTRARANLSFLGAVPKFVLDAALVGGSCWWVGLPTPAVGCPPRSWRLPCSVSPDSGWFPR